MKLYSARLAWHDAFYTPWDSVMHHGLELAKLGRWVQTSERDGSLGRMVHQAIAGRVQSAIAGLPAYLQCFGHHLYAPVIDIETSNGWEEVATDALELSFETYLQRQRQDISEVKRKALWFVCRGVLVRYRHMVQGGMGANPDPMAAPFVFRGWLADTHGVVLDRRNWSREWGWIIQQLFREAGRLDVQALSPVARVLSEERMAA